MLPLILSVEYLLALHIASQANRYVVSAGSGEARKAQSSKTCSHDPWWRRGAIGLTSSASSLKKCLLQENSITPYPPSHQHPFYEAKKTGEKCRPSSLFEGRSPLRDVVRGFGELLTSCPQGLAPSSPLFWAGVVVERGLQEERAGGRRLLLLVGVGRRRERAYPAKKQLHVANGRGSTGPGSRFEVFRK